MKEPIGQKYWAIAEGYIPALSHGKEPEMTSHETACLLNATEKDAHVQITIYFSDRDPGDRIQSQFPPEEPCTCDLMTCSIRSRFRAQRTTPASLNRMCPSWCSIRALIRGKTRTPC